MIFTAGIDVNDLISAMESSEGSDLKSVVGDLHGLGTEEEHEDEDEEKFFDTDGASDFLNLDDVDIAAAAAAAGIFIEDLPSAGNAAEVDLDSRAVEQDELLGAGGNLEVQDVGSSTAGDLATEMNRRGVVGLTSVLSPETASELRNFVLAEREAVRVTFSLWLMVASHSLARPLISASLPRPGPPLPPSCEPSRHLRPWNRAEFHHTLAFRQFWLRLLRMVPGAGPGRPGPGAGGTPHQPPAGT